MTPVKSIPNFLHKVNGSFYRSDAVVSAETQETGDFATLTDYKNKVRAVYGDLRGVKFFTKGADYTELGFGGVPVKDGRYVL